MIVIGLIACFVLELVHLDVVYGKHHQLYEQYDALFVARCEAPCWNLKNRNKCTKLCLLKDMEKPGQCPGADSVISPFAAICLNICKQDSQCPSVTKCCAHSCGITCQHPKGLELEKAIPGIPSDIIVTERRRKRTIQLKWVPGESPPGTTLYVIEQRHYAGQYFMENRMGDWTPCMRTIKPYAILKRLVKPGRWYQFRVAAVNGNGTRGYSENSLRFTTSVGPRPPKLPQNVTVGPLLQVNGTLSTELRWKPPNSDLPIDRYKVFWSKRLHGASALDSVLVHQQTIPKDHTKFILQNLQPNSLYFLQVQALAQFGKNRLKGEKSGLVLNTSSYTNVTDNFISIEENRQGRIKDLHLQKLFWSEGELHARIEWHFRSGIKRYTVSWWSGSCHRTNNKNNGNLHLTLAATTKSPYFDLYDLEFGCRYRVSVREVTSEGMKSLSETSISFTTPSCKDFQKRHEELICLD